MNITFQMLVKNIEIKRYSSTTALPSLNLILFSDRRQRGGYRQIPPLFIH